MFSERGQTLMELIVVTSVSVIIIGALVFATIASLRNAQFSKNQSQATKLAQAGIETVRSFRDRGMILERGNTAESIPPNFKRRIIIEDSESDSKKVTVIVSWDDFSGTHESHLTTILRKL